MNGDPNADESQGGDCEVTITLGPPSLAHCFKVIQQEFAYQWPPMEQAAFQRALKAANQPSPGRPSEDDREAVAEARDLLRSGIANSEREAARLVARSQIPGTSETAERDRARLFERIRRKMRPSRKKCGV